MPELPDIEAYLSALGPRISGGKLERVRLGSPFLLRTVDPPLAAAEGREVCDLRRVGKRIAIGVEGDLWLVLHLMIAGRLHWKRAGAALPGKRGLAAFDFPQRRAAAHRGRVASGARRCIWPRARRGFAALDPGGIDVLAATLDAFAAALTAENHTLKRSLTDPRLFSGIGNAYSDEILHAARLSPVALTRKLSAEEMRAPVAAARATLRTVDREAVRRSGATRFPSTSRRFARGWRCTAAIGQPCPRCGAKVQRIRYAANETNYCVPCQTGGRLLADRGLSRLLREDWPRIARRTGGAYFVTRRFAKCAIVPGPTHSPIAPEAAGCFRSFTMSVGCSLPCT